jgi:hypothetical protein
MRGTVVVGGKKSENGGNIRSGAGSQPIDQSYNALIAFSTAFKIRVMFVWWDGVYGDTRAIRRHVGDLFECVYSKTVSSEFCKCCLGKKDRYGVIIIFLLCKSSAKKSIHGTHEVSDHTFLKFRFEAKFLMRVSGIINEVINVDPHMDRCLIRFITGEGRHSDNTREQTWV